jgi:hypothetical protein
MAKEKNKWIDAVGKLLEFTQEGSLSWESINPPAYLNSEPANSRVDVVYKAHYKDRTLRLYEKRYKVERPIYDSSAVYVATSVTSFVNSREYPYWTSTTVLELLDGNGLSPWVFPKTQVLDDLLDAVRYQVSGVKDFLHEILAEAS